MSRPLLFAVYTAKAPFLDSKNDKVRPVIVISEPQGLHGIVAVVPVSSKSKKEKVDVNISGWSQSGLSKPSIARVHRLFTLLKADLSAEIGALTASDEKNLKVSLRNFLGL